jgi:hypothetical protein
MLMIITIFLIAQWTLLAIYQRIRATKFFGVVLAGAIVSIAISLIAPLERSQTAANPYAQRGATTFEDSMGRVQLSIELLMSAYSRSEGIGLGAGAASQGARFVGIDSGAAGAAEAGTGKIMVELGIPGIIVLAILFTSIFHRLRKGLNALNMMDDQWLYYGVSLCALLIANIVSFFISSLVYGDSFVLIILGLLTGFLFSLCNAALQSQQRYLSGSMPP